MEQSDLGTDVREALSVDATAFQERVEAEAAFIESELDEGTFDNPEGQVGLEYEFYAVADTTADARYTEPNGRMGSLARLPRRLLEYVGFEKELGLHNAEMSTTPAPLNRYGLRSQAEEVRARLETAGGPMQAEGLRLVSDGMWTVPPTGETAREYLTDSVETEGMRIATNMTGATRYHAMANSDVPMAMVVDAPHVHLEADTVMPESLITSIQPHYQVPHAPDLPTHFRYALRIAGPLLALAVNSPFFPPDLYDEGATADEILDDAWDESRITVFESVLNPEEGPGKVRFPFDVDTIQEAIHRIVADETAVPMPVTTGDRFDDEFAHFKHKHGTFWRWIRPVFEGATRSQAHARIEFRPLPGQPTVRDTVALQAAFAGLLSGLVRREHPVASLSWETARENFYAAAREGLDAEMTWTLTDGSETTDTEELYRDLFAHAANGLAAHGLSGDDVSRYLSPLRERVGRGVTPADWKRRRVCERLDDGEDFETAVYGMQRTYIDRQRETLLEGGFLDWLQ